MRSGSHGWWIVLGSVLLAVVGCSRNPVAPTATAGAYSTEAGMDPVSEQPLMGGTTHPRPFTGTAKGQASFDFSNPRGCAAGFTTVTDAKGTATHLGLTTLRSEHCVTPTGELAGTMVLTSANGDEIHATYSGSATAPGAIGTPVRVTAAVVVAGGTGRFARASGKADLTAKIVFKGFDTLTWPGAWQWKGTITY